MKKKLHCWYFIATGMLFAVGLLGQLLCDGLGYSIMTGKYLLYILCFVVVCAVCYGVLRLLHGKGRLRRGIAWVLGTIVVAWTGFCLLATGVAMGRDFCAYGNGWVLAGCSYSEEYRALSQLTHWFGAGEPYYQYTDADAVAEENHPDGLEQEPYQSASMERAKAAEVFWSYRGQALLNVVSYQYGRWYLLLYSLTVILWTVTAVGVVAAQRTVLLRVFWALILLPTLVFFYGAIGNALGWWYTMVAAPIFFAADLWEALMAQFFFLGLFSAAAWMLHHRDHQMQGREDNATVQPCV